MDLSEIRWFQMKPADLMDLRGVKGAYIRWFQMKPADLRGQSPMYLREIHRFQMLDLVKF